MSNDENEKRTNFGRGRGVVCILPEQSSQIRAGLFAFEAAPFPKDNDCNDELVFDDCVHWESRNRQDILKRRILRDTVYFISGSNLTAPAHRNVCMKTH